MEKILILGGTQFIGRNLVDRLQDEYEYEVTLFNRQLTTPNLFPNINKIKGNRETEGINQISNKHWDYVIDLSCYYPQSLTNTLNCLSENLKKYIFISTCSVYNIERDQTILKNETAEILPCNDIERIDQTINTYGNRKAECERILQDSRFNHIILRPSLVYGKYDHTDRLYYWLYQVKQSDTLLLPDRGEKTFSLTYVNDLVNIIIQALRPTQKNGLYNLITIPQASIKQITDCTKKALQKFPLPLNASANFLKKQDVSQWTDMPLWIDGDFFTFDNRKLQDDFDLDLTPLQDSIEDSINYFDALGWPKPKYGIAEHIRNQLIEQIKNKKH